MLGTQFLIDKIAELDHNDPNVDWKDIFRQAKEYEEENIKLSWYEGKHFPLEFGLSDEYYKKNYADWVVAPHDNERVIWEQIDGKGGVGTYVAKEDMFLKDNGDFTYRQFIKSWDYV